MRCPFLGEAEGRFCEISPFRKILFNKGQLPDDEKCSGAEFVSCPLAAARPEVQPGARSCPFLRESLVQFCSAAPATQFIPYSETLLSCCQSEGHRYCDLFLNQAEPERLARPSAGGEKPDAPDGGGARGSVQWVDDIEVPLRLAFSPNHMWIDSSEDGSCHLGVDAFLAKVIGSVEKVSFVVSGIVCRPAAVLRVCGVDLTMVFPGRLQVNRSNVHLRGEPERIVSDPYGRGWLFEGRVPADPACELRYGPFPSLLRGKDALVWMRRETARMTEFVHALTPQAGAEGRELACDGGSFQAPIARHLAPEDLLFLFNSFFSLDMSWKLP